MQEVQLHYFKEWGSGVIMIHQSTLPHVPYVWSDFHSYSDCCSRSVTRRPSSHGCPGGDSFILMHPLVFLVIRGANTTGKDAWHRQTTQLEAAHRICPGKSLEGGTADLFHPGRHNWGQDSMVHCRSHCCVQRILSLCPHRGPPHLSSKWPTPYS